MLFINGRRLDGARPAEVMDHIIDEEIHAADQLLARGIAPAALYNQLVQSAAEPAPVPATVKLSPAKLERLTGTYQVEGGPRLVIRCEADHLVVESNRGPGFALWPISDTVLLVKPAAVPGAPLRPARFTMLLDRGGQVRGAEILRADDTVAHATRADDTPAVRPAAPIPVTQPQLATVSSDSFEGGALTGWRSENRGAGRWLVDSSGKQAPDSTKLYVRLSPDFRPDPSRFYRRFPIDLPGPPQGRFAAVTDMAEPGTRILYRDVSLDGRYRLGLTIYYVSLDPLLEAAPATLDHEVSAPNQQVRIDVIAVSTPIDTLGPPHVLATVFSTSARSPQRLAPTRISFDLAPWQGQVVRLRLLVTDNRGQLRAGVDDVRFERAGD